MSSRHFPKLSYGRQYLSRSPQPQRSSNLRALSPTRIPNPGALYITTEPAQIINIRTIKATQPSTLSRQTTLAPITATTKYPHHRRTPPTLNKAKNSQTRSFLDIRLPSPTPENEPKTRKKRSHGGVNLTIRRLDQRSRRDSSPLTNEVVMTECSDLDYLMGRTVKYLSGLREIRNELRRSSLDHRSFDCGFVARRRSVCSQSLCGRVRLTWSSFEPTISFSRDCFDDASYIIYIADVTDVH